MFPSRRGWAASRAFSLIRRPAPYDLAQQMLLASGRIKGSQWDALMFHLARWLTRHLDDPRLVIWIAEHGTILQQLVVADRTRTGTLCLPRAGGETAELDEIRQAIPNAIPSPLMRTLWRLLLGERVKSNYHGPDLYRWIKRLKWEG